MEFEEYYTILSESRNVNNFINQLYLSVQDAEGQFYEFSQDEIVINMLEEVLDAIETAQYNKSIQIMELKQEFNNKAQNANTIGFCAPEVLSVAEVIKTSEKANIMDKVGKVIINGEEHYVELDDIELVDFDIFED